MVQENGILVLIVLVVAHTILLQQSTVLSEQINYGNVEHRSYTENVKRSSYAHQVDQSQPSLLKLPLVNWPKSYIEPKPTNAKIDCTTETRIIKHPDEKIIHHPSSIYVKRPPTFVTINHPDIIIEPNPVVYHKPAAVVRSPVVYKSLPRKMQFRHVVKHIVQPIEKKVLLERKPSKYFLNQVSNTSNDARVSNDRYQPKTLSRVVYRRNQMK